MSDIKEFNTLIPDGEITRSELTGYLSSICPSFNANDFYEEFNNNPRLLFADEDGFVYSNILCFTENTERVDTLFYRNRELSMNKLFNEDNIDLSGWNNYDDDYNYDNYDDDYDDRFGYLEKEEFYDEDKIEEYDYKRIPAVYYYDEEDFNTNTYDKKGDYFYSFEDEWRRCKKLNNGIFINSKEDIKRILKKNNPYAYECSKSYKHPEYMLLAPELEQLLKAGYKFAEHILNDGFLDEEAFDYSLVVHEGYNPSEIFAGIGKPVYTALKDEISLAKWLRYNQLYSMKALTKEDILMFINRNFSVKALINFEGVLQHIDNDGIKRGCVSPKKLTGYVKKVGEVTALSDTKISDILSDYVKVCEELNMTPDFDRYNLLREHDRVVKILNETKDSRYNEEIETDYALNEPLCMKSNGLFIRPVKNREDLNNEGEKQHNCVASYAREIARRSCHIFILRRISSPDKSYITVEIDNNGCIKQALKSHNEEIDDDNALLFLKKWEKKAKKYYGNLKII